MEMKLRACLPVFLLLFAACPEQRKVFFWHIVSSDVEFGQCTDEAWFRDTFQAPDAGDNSYLIYELSKDGKTASTVKCTHVDVSTCSDDPDPITWNVNGNELTRASTFDSSIPDAGCTIEENLTETITDNGKTMTDALSDVLSLVDETAGACADLDTQVKAHSTNGFGLEGCVVTLTLTGELK